MLLSAIGCVALLVPAARFDDVTGAVRLPTTRAFSPAGLTGAGVAWVDWDGDGWADLLVGGGRSEPTRVWLNREGPDGARVFEPRTPDALQTSTDVIAVDRVVVPPGAGDAGPRDAVVLATADRGQLIVVPVGAERVEDRIPVAAPGVLLQSLTHGDLDGDGVQEIVVTAASCGAGRGAPRGVFTLRYGPRGYRWDPDGPSGPGCWAVAMVSDYDDDGRPDLVVAPDFGPVDGGGYVVGPDDTKPLPALYGMGIAAADADGDGGFDYAFSSLGPDLLWMSDGAGRRVALTSSAWADTGVRIKWGLAWGDFDNAGDLSLWAAAGPVDYPVEALRSGGLQPDSLITFTGLLGGQPVERAFEAGVADDMDHRAVILGDYDQDGRLDAVVTGPQSLTLFHNAGTSAGHWLELAIPDHPGARFSVSACGRTQRREWSGGTAGAAHEPILHVGLGDCTEAPRVAVRWPWRGAAVELGERAVDRRHTVAGPGEVWLDTALVAPGATVRARVTLGGQVAVAGQPVADAQVLLTAPAELGRHRLPITQDGRALPLQVELEVRAVPVDVVTSPYPAWSGEPFTLMAPPDTVQGEGVSTVEGRYVATGQAATFTTPGGAVQVPLVASFATEQDVTVRVVGGNTRVSFLPVDALGRARSEMTSGWTVAGADGKSSGDIGWVFATVQGHPEQFTLRRTSPDASVVVAGGVPGPVDLSKSRLWPTRPFVLAGWSDVVQVGVLLRDASGRVIVPDATALPSAPGFEAAAAGFELAGDFLDLPVYTVPLRQVDFARGAVPVAAAGLSATVMAVEPDLEVFFYAGPVSADLRTEDGRLRAFPRDLHGLLFGPGVGFTPALTYVGAGEYQLIDPPTSVGMSVGEDDGVQYVAGENGTWHELLGPSGGGAQSGCAAGPRGHLGLAGCLATLGLWLWSRRRVGPCARRRALPPQTRG